MTQTNPKLFSGRPIFPRTHQKVSTLLQACPNPSDEDQKVAAQKEKLAQTRIAFSSQKDIVSLSIIPYAAEESCKPNIVQSDIPKSAREESKYKVRLFAQLAEL